ncbi:DUF645 family protein [Vibrio cholerae]|nr:DUF645 family protein [Vibrio cholerae]
MLNTGSLVSQKWHHRCNCFFFFVDSYRDQLNLVRFKFWQPTENIITFSCVWFAGIGMFLITFLRDKNWVIILLGVYADNPIAMFLYRFFFYHYNDRYPSSNFE